MKKQAKAIAIASIFTVAGFLAVSGMNVDPLQEDLGYHPDTEFQAGIQKVDPLKEDLGYHPDTEFQARVQGVDPLKEDLGYHPDSEFQA